VRLLHGMCQSDTSGGWPGIAAWKDTQLTVPAILCTMGRTAMSCIVGEVSRAGGEVSHILVSGSATIKQSV